jgi:hypothetical protein
MKTAKPLSVEAVRGLITLKVIEEQFPLHFKPIHEGIRLESSRYAYLEGSCLHGNMEDIRFKTTPPVPVDMNIHSHYYLGFQSILAAHGLKQPESECRFSSASGWSGEHLELLRRVRAAVNPFLSFVNTVYGVMSSKWEDDTENMPTLEVRHEFPIQAMTGEKLDEFVRFLRYESELGGSESTIEGRSIGVDELSRLITDLLSD